MRISSRTGRTTRHRCMCSCPRRAGSTSRCGWRSGGWWKAKASRSPAVPTDSSAIDAAILDRLNGDATLMALLPHGVYFDRAPAGSTKFAIVSVVLAHDVAEFQRRAIEDVAYPL